MINVNDYDDVIIKMKVHESEAATSMKTLNFALRYLSTIKPYQ